LDSRAQLRLLVLAHLLAGELDTGDGAAYHRRSTSQVMRSPRAGIQPVHLAEALAEADLALAAVVRMGDLAARLSLAQSGATRVIGRLVDRGWVARELPPDNRRTTHAVLTDEGRAAFTRFQPLYEGAVQEHFAAALPPDGLVDLRRLLEVMLRSRREPKPEPVTEGDSFSAVADRSAQAPVELGHDEPTLGSAEVDQLLSREARPCT
jgi:DNA-binding MarR family transcriptional regulator